MLRNVWCVVRGWFVAPAPVSAPATVVVQSPMKSFEFYVLPSHKGKMVTTGTVTAANENSALQSIYALHGERVQIVGGGRYRVHNSNGGMLYTRIDRANRRREGDRRRHRETRVERADFGIVGE
jgi:hypothetical protein